ncbi:MAG TPA: hypothetical protein VK358_05305, partial [Longimicrobium sp.]|nr:hypothetical protein [Longimicrobium sp.]
VTVGASAGGAGAVGAAGGALAVAAVAAGASVEESAGAAAAPDPDTSKTPRQMEQRTRTPPAGTLAGSTRKTVLQCVHWAFMALFAECSGSISPAAA